MAEKYAPSPGPHEAGEYKLVGGPVVFGPFKE